MGPLAGCHCKVSVTKSGAYGSRSQMPEAAVASACPGVRASTNLGGDPDQPGICWRRGPVDGQTRGTDFQYRCHGLAYYHWIDLLSKRLRMLGRAQVVTPEPILGRIRRVQTFEASSVTNFEHFPDRFESTETFIPS